MFLINGDLHWSASDLTAAALCEYALLRTLDYKLGWADPVAVAEDPLLEHIARLGDRHEARVLDVLRRTRRVECLERVEPPYSAAALDAAVDATLAGLTGDADVLHQAAFYDGEFFGYADFVERTSVGWLVSDAKLAREAKPRALLQLGAYAHHLQQLTDRLGVRTAPVVALLLGDGQRAEFPVADVVPAFLERRDRLCALLHTHRAAGEPVGWGDDPLVACGSCEECRHAAEQTDDLILVAGLRMDQRRKLRTAGVRTVGELAALTATPAGMVPTIFAKLQAQAALQWQQMQAGEGAGVAYELTASAHETLALLPAPSAGDLFFDFEGDPMYDEGDPSCIGLEYLWGVMDAEGKYIPSWANDRAEEKDALVAFMERVAEARLHHPDMHIYHYAAYETTALKRLAMRYQTKEKELDDLLRSEVFVDLYATVRGSVRVSAPSYSIKKLEPLYMGDELRSDDDDAVADGGASIVAYHQYRELSRTDRAAAEKRRAALEDYNDYDCLSTLRLRDWLLARAEETGVADAVTARVKDEHGVELSDQDPVFLALTAKSGPLTRIERTPEEQAYAMLANAIDYYRREGKQFWWEHFDRLTHPLGEWCDTRDVFTVESAEVVQDWAVPEGKAKNARRVIRLVGDWAAGSSSGKSAQVVYARPTPAGVTGPDAGRYGAGRVDTLTVAPTDPRVVLLTESRKPGETFSDTPVALVPGEPPRTDVLEAAIMEVASAAASGTNLPVCAALDLLARRAPRLRDGVDLQSGGSPRDDVVAALLGMDDSYVAVQGPPGTGKTYLGSRVIKELVEKHHWRIGVVAQSHAVVENLLCGIVEAGLDAALVGKSKNDSEAPTWTTITDSVNHRGRFLEEHRGTGCVLGGTAWTFANDNLVERGGLDLLVIDEAGQFALAPTLAASVAAKRLLLLGDPQQLPQVSQGSHAEPIDESALGWLMDGSDTIPTELGYLLATSFRMHPRLCEKVSVLSYDGRLTAAPQAAERWMENVEPGLEVVQVNHTGNRTESAEEAAAVVAVVEAHLGRVWRDKGDGDARPLEQGDVLVVAPYNAQVALVRRHLDEAGLGDVRVGTVDKFQGQQAPIAIVSMTASSHGDVPRGMGFLLNRNRTNVAVSRAQWKAVVVRSEALTSYMPSSAQGVLELGAFIGLCRSVGDNQGRP